MLIQNQKDMTTEQITKEWAASLSAPQRRILNTLRCGFDFLVMGDAMPFIEEVAPAYGLNVICIKLQTLDDLRGTRVIKHSEKAGLDFFDYEVEWLKAVENSEKKSLVIFNIDDADDRLASGIKSYVENRGDEYFVGLICADSHRDLKHITTINVLCDVIHWD